MVLPDNFDEYEHLQSLFMRVHNKQVREAFSDLGGSDWVPDINTPRGSLRVACTIKDNDTAPMVNMRYLLFYLSLGRISEWLEPFYGIPYENVNQDNKFRPVVHLDFKEDEDDVDSDYQPLRMVVSFRLVSETSTTITRANLITIANRIRTEFATGSGFRFHKGKELWTYKDAEKGYNFRLYAFSETVARGLITSVLGCQNHTIDNTLLVKHQNQNEASAYPTVPGNQSILGNSRKKPRKRPVGYCRFRWARVDIWGEPSPVWLIDKTYRHDSLVNP